MHVSLHLADCVLNEHVHVLTLHIVYCMLSFGFSDHVTKSAELSSEDSTQRMKDLFLQKLI